MLRKSRIIPLIGMLIVTVSAAADTASPAPKPKPAAPEAPRAATAQPPAQPPIQMPNQTTLLTLIRSTLLALNQANITGNYSVFRELGSPQFQLANSVGRLSETFANLRHRRLDLSPLLFVMPQATRPPQIMPNGLLYITGFFSTTPERVNFELAYQLSQGRWQLFGIAVDTSPAVLQGAPQPRPPAASAAAPKVNEPPPKTAWTADTAEKAAEPRTDKK